MTAETYIETLNALSKVQADLVKKYELENPGFTLVRVVETDCSIVWEEANKDREQINRVYQDPTAFRVPVVKITTSVRPEITFDDDDDE